MRIIRISLVVSFLLAASACRGNRPAETVVVFHAAGLARTLGEMEEIFERENPALDVRLEPSGSQVAARKISELNRSADLVVSADVRVIDQLLIPQHAGWQLVFASTEMVLAFGEHSRGAGEISANDWPRFLLGPEVRLGRCDENTAPLGYQTLLVWKLAEQDCLQEPVPELAEKLKKKVAPAHLVADSEELAALLHARTIDYAFLFRSTVEEHNFQWLRLPERCNLGSPDLAAYYAKASVAVTMKPGLAPVQIEGAPLFFSLTIPRRAENPAGAEKFVEFMLGEKGRAVLARSGMRVLQPARCAQPNMLPEKLRAFAEAR